MKVPQGFLLASVMTVLAVWGEGAFSQTNAERQRYEDLKARQAAMAEYDRQREAELREGCKRYAKRRIKTPMNSRVASVCAQYLGG